MCILYILAALLTGKARQAQEYDKILEIKIYIGAGFNATWRVCSDNAATYLTIPSLWFTIWAIMYLRRCFEKSSTYYYV
ncbi:hypothetical protein Y032_0048g1544 [Ancylostoma ceylanicum]|uniref:Uncharacterized protein n=1 Tax=Ancylostoma ceylanicum TaxID=53326 RepID=A0A016UAL3_9BILA|nr:hypothetical protein Y032_0048g1544 [Ancylostoma ceylanicum]